MSKQLPYPSEQIIYMKKKNYFHENNLERGLKVEVKKG